MTWLFFAAPIVLIVLAIWARRQPWSAASVGEALEAFQGIFGATLASLVGGRATEALCGSQAAKTATPTPRRELETSSFEAYTHCGGCGKLDCHPMREPRKIDMDDQVDRTMLAFQYKMALLGIGAVARDESGFAVIRTCSSCSHEWGQR